MIVRIKGGLGNQLFQYSLIRLLQIKYGVKDVKADFQFFTRAHTFFEDRVSKLDTVIARATDDDINRICYFHHNQQIHTLKYRIPLFLEKTINKKYFFETNQSYHDPHDLLKYSYLDGYWQSWKYLSDIRDAIIKEISILYRCSDKTKRIAEQMMHKNAVMVGVRKGDYTLTKKARKRFYQIDSNYQENAIKYIAERVENPVFYIFSNDIKWVHDNLKFDGYQVVFREPNDQVNDIEEMQLMSAAKHAVIPNSTFHWFGAWMINNPKKIVVRPRLFFADGSPIDLYPPEWVSEPTIS